MKTEAGVPVLSRGQKLTGTTTGATRRCRLEGCPGIRIATRWPRHGKHKACVTYPCSKGMEYVDGKWFIM